MSEEKTYNMRCVKCGCNMPGMTIRPEKCPDCGSKDIIIRTSDTPYMQEMSGSTFKKLL